MKIFTFKKTRGTSIHTRDIYSINKFISTLFGLLSSFCCSVLTCGDPFFFFQKGRNHQPSKGRVENHVILMIPRLKKKDLLIIQSDVVDFR